MCGSVQRHQTRTGPTRYGAAAFSTASNGRVAGLGFPRRRGQLDRLRRRLLPTSSRLCSAIFNAPGNIAWKCRCLTTPGQHQAFTGHVQSARRDLLCQTPSGAVTSTGASRATPARPQLHGAPPITDGQGFIVPKRCRCTVAGRAYGGRQGECQGGLRCTRHHDP